MASVIMFVLNRAGNPAPYYWNAPQNFQTPAAFFPPPELTTGGETFLTYYVDYTWYIKLFHHSDQGAYALASQVVQAIRGARNLIPLICEDGNVVKDEWVRVDDPKAKLLDSGAAQLTLSWRGRKPYDDTLQEGEKVQHFYPQIVPKPGKTVTEAYADALERYAIPLNSSGDKR